MKEINAKFTKKQDLFAEPTETEVKRIIWKGNVGLGTFPKRMKEFKRKILANSRVLHSFTLVDLHPNKILLFLGVNFLYTQTSLIRIRTVEDTDIRL